jgi:cytoskeletal protein RodZ
VLKKKDKKLLEYEKFFALLQKGRDKNSHEHQSNVDTVEKVRQPAGNNPEPEKDSASSSNSQSPSNSAHSSASNAMKRTINQTAIVSRYKHPSTSTLECLQPHLHLSKPPK